MIWRRRLGRRDRERPALFSAHARERVVNAQRDLMAGRAEAAVDALDRLTEEIDEVLRDLDGALALAELGYASEAICRLEAILHPGRAVA
jgi:hypothetical protein